MVYGCEDLMTPRCLWCEDKILERKYTQLNKQVEQYKWEINKLTIELEEKDKDIESLKTLLDIKEKMIEGLQRQRDKAINEALGLQQNLLVPTSTYPSIPVYTISSTPSPASGSEALLLRERKENEKLQKELKEADWMLFMKKYGITDASIPLSSEIIAKKTELDLPKDCNNIVIVSEASLKGFDIAMKKVESMKEGSPLHFESMVIKDRLDVFRKAALYVYDLVLLLATDRITDTLVGVAIMCHRCLIPYIFVRHRMSQIVDEVQKQLQEDALTVSEGSLEAALRLKTEEIYKDYDNIMKAVFLPSRDQRANFFLIDNNSLDAILKGETSEGLMDENKLLNMLAELKKD